MTVLHSIWLALATGLIALTRQAPTDLNLGDTLSISGFAILLVFVALVGIWILIRLMSLVLSAFNKKDRGAA